MSSKNRFKDRGEKKMDKKSLSQDDSTEEIHPRYTMVIMSDSHHRYYFIPAGKEQAFYAWMANGREHDYNGEDFNDYRCTGPLATHMLTNRSVN
jgi:hypothetical protein